jgi:pimeloyl-ACP methyl ester carboxylesterase
MMVVSGCGAHRAYKLERVFAEARGREGKRPVIVIPGILGSQLVNRRTGEVVWPSAFRSIDDGMSLPIRPDLAANRDDLYPTKIIDVAYLARLAPGIYVYRELLDALRRYAGYREGDWDAPAPDGDRDTFYIFPYDFRRDNVETARELVRRIDELKRKLGRPDLRFNIVAHSMGGLVARYAAMYGDADLPDGDVPPQPTWAGASSINKIFMFGTPNEGSAEAFVTILEGYSITEGLRPRVRLFNKLTPEDAVSIPAVFQLLPHADAARFLDENLQPIKIDLYDPETWRRYGWSAINNPGFRGRFTRGRVQSESDAKTQSGTPADLDAYLAAVLRRAKRFHEALNAVAAVEQNPVPLFAFGGDCEETLAAPVLLRDVKTGNWETLFRPRALRNINGQRISRKEVTRAMFASGDGRVTRRSLLGDESRAGQGKQLFNKTLPLAYGVFACDLHSELQNNKTLQENALTLLISEATN